MFSRCCAGLGTLMLMSYAAASASDAEAVLTFQNWDEVVQQTTLPDKSILTQYVASTSSTNTDGAELQVSFMPRFDCAPQISILLPISVVNEPIGLDGFVISVDQETWEFPVLADTDGSAVRFSMNAVSTNHQELRRKFDFAYEVTVSWQSTTAAAHGAAEATVTSSVASYESSNNEPANYSLLGSQAAVKAAEDQCNSHEPIPYDI